MPLKYEKVAKKLLSEKKVAENLLSQGKRMSHSKKSTWKTCRRKFWLQYGQGLSKREQPTYFVFGRIFHEEIERFYLKGRKCKESLLVKRVTKRIERELKSGEGLTPAYVDALWKMHATLCGMIRGYARTYKKKDRVYTVDATEWTFNVPVENTLWSYTGIVDLKATKKKKKYLWDHKTTSQMDSKSVLKMSIDKQLMGYAYAEKITTGKAPDYVMYNIIKKPGIRLKKDESDDQFLARVEDEYLSDPNKYFHREVIKVSNDKIKEFEEDFRQVTADIEDTIKNGRWYQDESRCLEYGGCPFLELCTGKMCESTMGLYQRGFKPRK